MSYIVCGFYTPDYAHWFERLEKSLNQHYQPYDFTPVNKIGGGWETNTLAKASHVLGAMQRHPTEAIIWLDVDCLVRGDLEPLAQIPGDVGIHFYIKKRKSRSLILRVRTATMVFRPTEAARRLAKAWQAYSLRAPLGEDDEATLTRAILDTRGVSITQIQHEWSSTLGKHFPESVIVHSYASRETPKVHRITRFLYRHLRVPAFATRT